MTNEQLSEANRAIGCLNEARRHLDTAMYGMGIVDINDADYKRIRKFYDAICKALDLT